MKFPVVLVCTTALSLTLAACGTPTTSGGGTAATVPVAIATTTQLGSILGDITTCAGATSDTLMKPGTDPHEFSLASDQVASMSKAKLVVANGLGLEGGMQAALANVKADGVRVYEVAPDLDALPFSGDTQDGAAHGALDPHVFLDVARMARAAVNIGKQLTDVTGDARYTTCGASVGDKLTKTDAEVRKTLETVPAARRILITDHDAFGYFSRAYGFTIAGVAVPGGSTDAEASSAQIAKVVAAVKAAKVPAIFSNTAVNPAVVGAIAQEAGANIAVVPLYVDSLGGTGSGAETYSDMMMADAVAIAKALA